jgi:uncharacterized protein YgiM (DUF1202 family)
MKRVLSILLLAGITGFAFLGAYLTLPVTGAEGTVAPVINEAVYQVAAENDHNKEAENKGDPGAKNNTGEKDRKPAASKKPAEGKKATDTASKDPAADQQEELHGIDMKDIVSFDEPVTMYVKSDVNIRKGPGTAYDIVSFADTGDEVTVIGRYGKAGWYYIDLGTQKAFVSNNYLLDNMEAVETYQAQLAAKAQEQAAAAAEAQARAAIADVANGQPAQQSAPQPAQPAAQPAPVQQRAPQPAPAIAGTLFIGDSRCVQMKALVGQSSWICENSKGYEWLESKAIAQADRIIGKGTRVVVCLGVNDTENVEKYAALINQKAAEWAQRGAKTYYVSVNPVTENPYRTEDEVEYFNSRMPGLLSGVTWIDTHSTLINGGFGMVDGLHYNDATNVNIYNMIIAQLK